MKIKTSELEGPALDWAVAKAIGRSPHVWQYPTGKVIGLDGNYPGSYGWEPSRDWHQGGPMIDEYSIEIMRAGHDVWAKIAGKRDSSCDGRTTLEAACRAVVRYKLGDTVDVPEELFK